MNPTKKSCVVTGGAGFIGSHLVESLLEQGHSVKIIDDLSTGRISNLKFAQQNPNLELHEVDVSEADTITPLFSGVDWVFHLAAKADIVPSIEQPLKYHNSNVNGTVAVLEAARKQNVERFIYTASSSCYGIPDEYPTPEEAPIQPEYPYAHTKYIGEEYVQHWNEVYDLPTVSLRLFNVFGPRHRTSGSYGAVFGVFLAQKLAGKPFTVVGDGTQTRDFTYVTDVAEAFIAAAESKVDGEIYNVGSGGTYSINRLVELLEGEVVHIPRRPGEPECTFADISKIQRELNWEPRVSFEDGVQRLLDTIEDWKDAPVWDEEGIEEATQDWFKYLGKERASQDDE